MTQGVKGKKRKRYGPNWELEKCYCGKTHKSIEAMNRCIQSLVLEVTHGR